MPGIGQREKEEPCERQHTIFMLDHNDIDCTGESSWIDGVPGLGDRTEGGAHVLHGDGWKMSARLVNGGSAHDDVLV